MFLSKQAKRSALADVSFKTSEALFAKQKCFFKFIKKQIFTNSVFCFPHSVFRWVKSYHFFVVPPPFSFSINLKRKRRQDRRTGAFAPATP